MTRDDHTEHERRRIRTPKVAAITKRDADVGFAIVDAPSEFIEALDAPPQAARCAWGQMTRPSADEARFATIQADINQHIAFVVSVNDTPPSLDSVLCFIREVHYLDADADAVTRLERTIRQYIREALDECANGRP